MQYNILFHAINGIGYGHIKRALNISLGIKSLKNIGNIVISSNTVFNNSIKKKGIIFEKLDYSIDDTISKISFEKYENQTYSELSNIIDNHKIHIVFSDTYFINQLIEKKRELIHYLILRDSSIEYLKKISHQFEKFKNIFIPHIKEELGNQKINFLKNYNNIVYCGYIVGKFPKKFKKTNEIIVSPGLGGDYDNTKFFFEYINKLLSDSFEKLKKFKIIFILGKHFEILKQNISFNKKFKIINFIENLDKKISNCSFFIGRGGYNSLNEVCLNNTKSLLLDVETKNENQQKRILFFKKKLKFNNIEIGTYSLKNDSMKILSLINKNFKFNKKTLNFEGIKIIRSYIKSQTIKNNILVFMNYFLPLSENHIYDEMKNIKNFNFIINCFMIENIGNYGNNFQIIYDEKYKDLQNYIVNSKYPNLNSPEKPNLKMNYFVEIIKIIKKFDIKIIYCQNLVDMYFFVFVKKFLKDIKLICALRGKDIYFFLPTLGDKISFLNQIDKILVRDKPMKSFIENQGINKKNIEVVRSFCDLSLYKFKIKNFTKLNLIFGGRITPKKCLVELIDLLILLKDTNLIKNIIGICGEGLNDDNLYNKIFNKKINKFKKRYKNIELIKFLKHDIYLKNISSSNFNLFINYSKKGIDGDDEGIPNMLIENILVGNLCFSTLTGGIGELGLDKYGLILTGIQKKDFEIITNFLLNNSTEKIQQIVYKLNISTKKIFDKKNSIGKLEKVFKNLI